MNKTEKLDAMSGGDKCRHCGTKLESGALAGLCPVCLLKQGVAEDTATANPMPPFRPPTVADLAPLFPQLEILELIGRGGMGAVYKARQPALDRFVALKLLPPAQADYGPAFAERFNREARALARLNHPCIVAVHEFGTAGSFNYFLMEFVDGINLRQLQKNRRLSAREALQIVAQICDALQYAHDEGIVHRDIKPENVLLDRRGRVKIADFGLAKLLDASPAEIHLTAENQVMGTPHYMAPEQIEHPQTVDHRADIYSLGVVLYELLTGELPLGKFPPPSCKVQLDVRLDGVVLRALEKQPELRYQHAGEVKTAVDTIVGSPPLVSAEPPVTPKTATPSPMQPDFRNYGWVALGLFLAGTLGTLMLLAISSRHELILAFGGLALVLALVFGIVSRRDRLGKAIAIATLTLCGVGLALLIASSVMCFARSIHRSDAMEQQALEKAGLDAKSRPQARKIVLHHIFGGEALDLDSGQWQQLPPAASGWDRARVISSLGSSGAELAAIDYDDPVWGWGLIAPSSLRRIDQTLWENPQANQLYALQTLKDNRPELLEAGNTGCSLYRVFAQSPANTFAFRTSGGLWAVLLIGDNSSHTNRLTIQYKLLTTVASPSNDLEQAMASLGALEGISEILEEALERKDQTNSALFADQFHEQVLLLNRSLSNTELQFPTDRLILSAKACDAIKAGNLTLGAALFKAAITTEGSDDDFPDKVAALAKRKREAESSINVTGAKSDAGSPAQKPFNRDEAELRLKLAEINLKEAEGKMRVGQATTQDRDQAQFARDMALAELKQDYVEYARLKLESAELDLKVAEKKMQTGVAPTSEFERAKAVRDSAAAAYGQVKTKKKQ